MREGLGLLKAELEGKKAPVEPDPGEGEGDTPPEPKKPVQGKQTTPPAKPVAKPQEKKDESGNDHEGLAEILGIEPEEKVEKKIDTPPIEDIKIDETTKAGKAMAAMRVQIKDLTEKLSKASSVNVEELTQKLTTLQTENAQLADRLGRISLAEDPRFIRKYQAQIEPIIDNVKGLLKDAGKEEKLAEQLMSMPVRDRIAYIRSVAPEIEQELRIAYQQSDMVLATRNRELAAHRETTAQLRQQEGEIVARQTAELRERVFSAALEQTLQEGFTVLKPTGNPKIDAKLKQIAEDAHSVVGSQDPVKQTKMIIRGATADLYRRLYLNELKARMELEKEFGKRRNAQPIVQGRRQPVGGTPSSMSAGEAASRLSERFPG